MSDNYLACVHAYRLDTGFRWLTANAVPTVVSAVKLLDTLAWYSDDDNTVCVLFHGGDIGSTLSVTVFTFS